MKNPPAFRHWTNRGTFRLDVGDAPGGRAVVISLDDRQIGFQWNFHTAARLLAQGNYDDKIGFPAASVGLPERVEDWIDPLAELDRIKE